MVLRAILSGMSLKQWLGVAAGAILAATLLIAAGYGFGYGEGRAQEAKESSRKMEDHLAEDRKRYQEQQEALAEANRKNRQLELDHEQRVSDLRAEFAQQQADAKARDQRTIDDLRDGNKRLRLQVASCSRDPAGAGENQSTAGGADDAGTAELAPEAAATLWGIAADGDSAIRQLTKLQDWARSAVKACGPQSEQNQ